MNWLGKHINLFFKINGILLILVMIFGTWAVLQLGIPHNNPFTWTPYQWHMIKFLWEPTLIYSLINILLIILCFIKKDFVFPATVLFLGIFLNTSTRNVTQVLTKGFIYPIDNIGGILTMLEFLLAIIGTIFWIRKIRGKNMPVNG